MTDKTPYSAADYIDTLTYEQNKLQGCLLTRRSEVILAALALAAKAEGEKPEPVAEYERIKLWFFRDLNHETRLKLFRLVGYPIDESDAMHVQAKLLSRLLKANTPDDGGRAEERDQTASDDYGAGQIAGAANERAEIVAWLRAERSRYDDLSMAQTSSHEMSKLCLHKAVACKDAAKAIASGAHSKGAGTT